jgi:prepilin-type N-terminal cleavage/methylation domain-containing protein
VTGGRARALRRRLAAQGGYTLSELLVVLAILGIVVGALAGIFTSALKAEVDMNRKFRAQQGARFALGKLRRELHCAQQAYVAPLGAAVTIVSAVSAKTAYCRPGQATWCVLAISGPPARYGLFRKDGATCDAAGVRVTDFLTSTAVFTLMAPVSGSRGRVAVDLRVDVDSKTLARRYRLYDEITMRGSARA